MIDSVLRTLEDIEIAVRNGEWTVVSALAEEVAATAVIQIEEARKANLVTIGLAKFEDTGDGRLVYHKKDNVE